jgi:gluconokinase
MIILLTGVAGAGKTTVGVLLADALGWPFYDADAFHPAANVEKMRRNVPLTDADRLPWLMALRRHFDDLARQGMSAVVACSALKQTYRDRLLDGPGDVRLVYLKGTFGLIRERMEKRSGHYFKIDLLRSQFDALEEPHAGLVVDTAQPPEAIAHAIRQALNV